MSKLTREQQLSASLADAREEIFALTVAAQTAYAAGRRSGMECAAALCDQEVAFEKDGQREYVKGFQTGAYVCAHAIRAAMEADK